MSKKGLRLYILEGHTPIPAKNTEQWGSWFGSVDHHVADDEIDGIRVSTVFVGIDYSFGLGPPLFYETMVFGGRFDQCIQRYETWDEAEKGHRQWVNRVKIGPVQASA